MRKSMSILICAHQMDGLLSQDQALSVSFAESQTLMSHTHLNIVFRHVHFPAREETI